MAVLLSETSLQVLCRPTVRRSRGARCGGDLQRSQRGRAGVPPAQGRAVDAADLPSGRASGEGPHLRGRVGAAGAAAAGASTPGGRGRHLGGAGDGGAGDSAPGDAPHEGSGGASRCERGQPGRASRLEGTESDRTQAAGAAGGRRDGDVVTIRKFAPCPPRTYVGPPQTWGSARSWRQASSSPLRRAASNA